MLISTHTKNYSQHPVRYNSVHLNVFLKFFLDIGIFSQIIYTLNSLAKELSFYSETSPNNNYTNRPFSWEYLNLFHLLTLVIAF